MTDWEDDLFRSSGEAVMAVGDDGIVRFATPQACELLGWRSLVGQPLTSIIPDRLQPAHRAGFERYVRTGESHLLGKTVRVPARRRDGSEVDIDLTIRVFRRPDGTKLVSAILSQAALGRPPANLKLIEDALSRRMYELV